MTKKYTKPIVRDLSGVPLATGSCFSGTVFPNQCVNWGDGNSTQCVAGLAPAFTPPDCGFGEHANTSCTSGNRAGTGG